MTFDVESHGECVFQPAYALTFGAPTTKTFVSIVSKQVKGVWLSVKIDISIAGAILVGIQVTILKN